MPLRWPTFNLVIVEEYYQTKRDNYFKKYIHFITDKLYIMIITSIIKK